MARLTDIPHELLEEILFLASGGNHKFLQGAAVVNKQFQQVAPILLLRHWERGCNPQRLVLLALHLYRYPELHTKIKSLNFGPLDAIDINDLTPDPNDLELQPGRRDWPYQVKRGCEDALAALILAWATRVTHVEFLLSRWTSGIDNRYLMTIELLKWAVQEFSTKPQNELGDLPFAEVQYLQFMTAAVNCTGDDEFPVSVFRLPKLKTLHTEDMGFKNPRDVSIPKGCSAVEELRLVSSGIPGVALIEILAACRRLRVLYYGIGTLRPQVSNSKKSIAKAILSQAESLEELHLGLHCEDFMWSDELPEALETSYDGVALERCFIRLTRLKALTLDMEDLLPTSYSPLTPTFIVTSLPASLESLTIDWKNHMYSSREEDLKRQGKRRLWLSVVVALRGLLEEAGPGCKFGQLKYLNVLQILHNATALDLIGRLAESKGIKFERRRARPEYRLESVTPYQWVDED